MRFDLERLAEAQRLFVSRTMESKKGDGAIFINCMEKLTMNSPRDTLQTRLLAAMDSGIEGITLSAGLHLGSMELMKDHPRFHDVLIGIIVSSARALRPFLNFFKFNLDNSSPYEDRENINKIKKRKIFFINSSRYFKSTAFFTYL